MNKLNIKELKKNKNSRIVSSEEALKDVIRINWGNEDIMEDRKTTLLKACLQLLQKQEESSYVLNLLEETVYYDEADCDGYCLMEDIKIELEEMDYS